MRIALIGSAPSSLHLAPFEDKSWTIWACSPGAAPALKRCDAFFELHRREIGKPWFHDAYMKFLKEFQGELFVAEPWPEFPKATVLPKDGLMEKFGPYFFTSSLSWMFASAIIAGATEIGLWGVDMSAQEEWAFQRSGCHFFIWEARRRGITVRIPPESDLWMPPPLYGFQEINPHHVKLMRRREELLSRLQDAQNRINAATQEYHFLQGALDDNEYHLKTWVSDRKQYDLAIHGPTEVFQILPPADPQPVDTEHIAQEIEIERASRPVYTGYQDADTAYWQPHTGANGSDLPQVHRSE